MRELLYETRRTLGVIELKHALVPEEFFGQKSLVAVNLVEIEYTRLRKHQRLHDQ